MLMPLAAFLGVLIGGLILWSNPARTVNRVTFTCSLHIAAWLLCRYLAMTSPSDGLRWLKWTCAVSALGPFHFWMVKECIAQERVVFNLSWLRRSWGWMLFSILTSAVVFTEYFIPSYSTANQRVFGWGYYGFIGGVYAAYLYLFYDAYLETKRLVGGRRLEVQVWLGGGCAMGSTILTLMALNALTKDPVYLRPQALVVLIFFTGTAVAITINKIFDARQIIRLCLEKITLVVLVAGVAVALEIGFSFFLPPTIGFLATTAAALWFSVKLNDFLNGVFQFYPEATAARRATYLAAQQESKIDRLEGAFLSVLRGWGQTENAVIISEIKETLGSNDSALDKDGLLLSAMRELKWVTPERLARERTTTGRDALVQFIQEKRLGVLIFEKGPGFSILIGVGVGASRRPYTYPQVTQLHELASIMESALERAHFSTKVQRSEQLATVGLLGASLAHEIRNPLVSIKTFVQLLPSHYEDARFRDKFFKLIGEEVGRIDQLTQQLLDLSSPRTYESKMIELHPLIRGALELVSAKAGYRQVKFITDLGANPDEAFTDASAAKQVLLNLCFNAIQAVELQPSDDRWIRVSTRNREGGIELIVSDSGPGIAPELRAKLFQPFQTTKSSGFGLGLAICSDILSNIKAIISVDPHEFGYGATFRVFFPCQPSSS
jgi:signal transduction histidine kinase